MALYPVLPNLSSGGHMADKGLWWTVILFCLGLSLLGVSPFKSVPISVAAGICWHLNYGKLLVKGLALLVLVLSLAVWIGLLPPTAQWSQAISHFSLASLH